MTRTRFEGRIAVVTGAGSGIGAASARRLASEGAHVLAIDVAAERVTALAREIGGEALVLDVSDPRAWDEIARCEPTLAHLNAGVGTPGLDLGAFDDEVWEHIRGVNLDAMVWGIRAVVPAMRRNGGGAIVMTASTAGLQSYGGDPFYTATKYGVVGLARAAAQRLARDRITVDALCPALVDTPMAALMIAKQRRDDPTRAVLSPDDVAGVVADALADEGTGRALVCRAGHGLHVAPEASFD